MARILDIADGFSSSVEPILGNIQATSLKTFASDAAFVAAKGSAAAEGDCYYNTTLDVVRVFTNNTWTFLPYDENVVHKTSNESIAGDKTFQDNVVIQKDLTVQEDVTIAGDLTVNGTQTIINTSVLEVEDKNILLNKGGTDATSENGGITIERTSTNGVFLYDSSLSSKFKCGNSGSASEVITSNAQQVLLNKDYDGGTASNTSRLTLPKNTTANLNSLTRKQATIFYDTTVNKIKYDDGTNLKEIGSGVGGINYLLDWKIIFSGYNDGAVEEPVDGTGGTLNNLSLSLSTSNALDGESDLKITKAAANARGEGVSFDFKVPNRANGNMHTIKFVYYMNNASLPDDTFTVWLYKKDSPTRQLQPVPYKLKTTTIPTKFQAQIQLDYDTNLANVDDWRLEIHCAGNNTTASDLYISDLEFSPTQYTYGAFVSDWIPFTPTGTWTVNTTYHGAYRRVGDSIDLYYRFTLSGQPNAANLNLDLPSGLSIDVNKIPIQNHTDTRLGEGRYTDVGTWAGQLVATYFSSTQLGIRYVRTDGMNNGVSEHYAVTNSLPFVPTNGDFGNVIVRGLPIAGWSSNQVLSDETDTRQVIFSIGAGGSNQTLAAADTLYKVTFGSSPVVQDDTFVAWDNTNKRYIFKMAGLFDVTSLLRFNVLGSANMFGEVHFRLNGATIAITRQMNNNNPFDFSVMLAKTIQVKAGDYLEVWAMANAANKTIYSDSVMTYLTIVRHSGATQIAASEKEYFRIAKSSAQSISSPSGATITFQTIKEQSHAGAWDSVNNLYRFQKSGCYIVSLIVRSSINQSSSTYVGYDIRLNATPIAGPIDLYNSLNTTKDYTACVTVPIIAKANDTLSILGYSTTNGVSFTVNGDGQSTQLSIYSQGGI